MINLMRKEFSLSMHPTVPIMIILSVMVVIPNYPYSVIFFYSTLAVFFTCLSGRENNDITYSLMLPIGKKEVVKGRIGFTVLQEMVQLAFTMVCIIIKSGITKVDNLAGTDASLTLIGLGFIIYAVFNLVFFTSYYGNVLKVGIAFVKGCVVTFLLVICEVVLSVAGPVYSEILDSPFGENIMAKVIFTLICALFFLGLTCVTIKISENKLEKIDL